MNLAVQKFLEELIKDGFGEKQMPPRGAFMISWDPASGDRLYVYYGSTAYLDHVYCWAGEAEEQENLEKEQTLVGDGLREDAWSFVASATSDDAYAVALLPIERPDTEYIEDANFKLTPEGNSQSNLLVRELNDLVWDAWAVARGLADKEIGDPETEYPSMSYTDNSGNRGFPI